MRFMLPMMPLRRLAVDRGLVERRGLIDAFEVEADDLLRLAVFLKVKSLAVRPRTTSPVFLSRTTTLVSTRSLLTLRVKAVLRSGAAGAWSCAPSAARRQQRRSRARAVRLRRCPMTFMELNLSLEPVAGDESELTHGGGGGDLAVGCRAQGRVYA